MRLSLLLPLLLISFFLSFLVKEVLCIYNFTRNDFPADFVFGAGTSSYQYEGAVAEDGRTPSIWDTFTHEGGIPDKSTGDIASDGYHKYKEDAKLMSDVGLEAYRFSISWSRVLPNGRGTVNPKGLEYYKSVVDEIFERGIKIHVSLHHLDLPQVLHDEYGGWLSHRIVDDFKEFADLCFREFGDKVSHWTTIVEPNVYATAGYDSGLFAPERCSYPFGLNNCTAGNSTTEPYIAVHNMLLAHAEVVKLYRTKYQGNQNGKIGLNFYSFWGYPFSNSSVDIKAVQRVFEFQFGWILNPIVFGDYPEIMRTICSSRLPNFTTSQIEMLKGSFDFIGLNHYTSAFVMDNSIILKMYPRDYILDMGANIAASRNETPSGSFVPTHPQIDPAGYQNMLEYLKHKYGDPPIYVEENGYGLGVNGSALNDYARIDFLRQHIGATLEAIRNGVNVKGYFVWSFVDVFEYLGGYQSRCGLYHVDFDDDLRPRTPKLSAHWYYSFLKNNSEAFSTERTDLQNLLHFSQLGLASEVLSDISLMYQSLLLLLLHLILFFLPFFTKEVLCIHKFTRNDFPLDFVFGAGTSSYQYEGAVAEDGRTPSIWDTFAHEGRAPGKSTADITADGYHKYKEDVKFMSDVGLEAYRFSISWSRILPNGRGAVNPKGLEYYRSVVNEIFERGIKIHVSLHHLDLPQIIHDEYGGWLSPRIVDDFKEYADLCFREFGEKVSHWTTIVEPNVYGMAGYDSGLIAPGRCSYPFGLTNCTAGDSTTEPYIAVHNMLIAHAEVVKLYRTKYQGNQNGNIGINFYSFWCYPYSNSSANIEAVQRVFDFQFGWVLNPVVFGDYPEIMKKICGSKLPNFTTSQKKLLKGSFDFIGLNYYTSAFVIDNSNILSMFPRDYNLDMAAKISASRNDTASGAFVPTHPQIDPTGLQNMLDYLKHSYGDPPIYVEENGYNMGANSIALNDSERIDFLRQHIGATLEAVRNGVNVKGYFVWSFVDVFEFLTGYQTNCGLYHVDFNDDSRPRTPKLSAHWYSNFLKNNCDEAFSIERTDLQNLLYFS
ncbi:lactase-phlorizin hydrolase [Dendrobium catenatum]|nr:lactase-phlorizin hydrolase [Dendrobium catenatum]